MDPVEQLLAQMSTGRGQNILPRNNLDALLDQLLAGGYPDVSRLDRGEVEDAPGSYFPADGPGPNSGGYVNGPQIPRGRPGWEYPSADGQTYPAGNGATPQMIEAFLRSITNR